METVRLPKVNEDWETGSAVPPAYTGGARDPHEVPPAPGTPALPPATPVESKAIHAEATRDVLLWQASVRLDVAVFLGIGALIARVTGIVDHLPPLVILSVAIYALVAAGVKWLVQRDGRARARLIEASIAADIALVFGLTFEVVPPPYYDRVLLLSFGILHVAEFYFGRRLAAGALGAISVMYLGIVLHAMQHGAPLSWPQELLSLAVFVAAGGTLIMHYGSFRERLASIVHLFERAESGDFAGTYDVSADVRPDAVTMVGRAYNRVREQLATMVHTDPLSGCYNRRGLEQRLERELRRASRSRAELALLVLDIDYFKRVNDTFGHLAGDAVVQQVGEVLRGVARVTDVVARTGGDEFAILLPDTSAAGAFRLATRLLESVSARQFSGITGKLPITVSIGLVTDRVTDAGIARDLQSRADEALYASKESGRNRVTIWTPNLRTIALARARAAVPGSR
ncbi:MAG TPA: GGDEF domain-containing protein [Gemmatimonadaceae bacterium]|nr:GGDEF domain-containing protein [Gemmatimonadaceae bacterium]